MNDNRIKSNQIIQNNSLRWYVSHIIIIIIPVFVVNIWTHSCWLGNNNSEMIYSMYTLRDIFCYHQLTPDV